MERSLSVQTECRYDGTIYLSPIPRPCIAPAGGKIDLRLFIKAETPTSTELLVKFDRAITDRPYRAEIVADSQDRSIIIPLMRLPDQPRRIFFPDRIEISMGDFRYRTRLPDFELLSKEEFLEYIVIQQLEHAGFQCDWLSRRNPRFPNIRAIFKPKPPPEGEVLHIECTTQKPYNSQKFYADWGKFNSEKNAWNPKFTRLLIVPLYPDIPEDVSTKLAGLSEPVSIISYPTLAQLVKQVERGIMERHKAYELLQGPGQIRISRRVSADDLLPGVLRFTYAFRLGD